MAKSTRTHLPPSDNAGGEDFSYNQTKSLTKQEFARKLYSLMSSRGWSQSETARRSGLRRAAVSTYVNGRSFPEPASLEKLARAFNMSSGELLPNSIEAAIDDDSPALEIKQSLGHPELMWMRLNRLLTPDQAHRIMTIVMEEDPLKKAKREKQRQDQEDSIL